MRNQRIRDGRWNRKMQRVDAGYLYELGDSVRCIGRFNLKDVPAYEMFAPLVTCRSKLTDFLQNSVYSGSLRGIHAAAGALCTAIDELVQRMVNEQLQQVTSIDQYSVQQAYARFEPALQAELSNQVTYLVLPKGVYDIVALIEHGSQLFPYSVNFRAPEAVDDIVQGAKSMAFELWTSAAFHFHRANESVLRRYYDHCVGVGQRPKMETMGTLLKSMEDKGVGDKQVLVALTNIKDFHRNPIIHPGQFVEDAEEAFSLVAAIRAAMGYMLDRLPNIDSGALMEATPNPGLAEPNFLSSDAKPEPDPTQVS